ncbi:VOC family protein [Sphingomonadaceae bacterium G21617-S1]|nr:VOC family protein [Sphingomonadaceae bacterium G21617-S1]
MSSQSKDRTGLPGLRGTDHVGFTVPDLNQAVRFFVEDLGCQEVYRLGPFQSDASWMEDHLDVHPRAVMIELSLLRCGHGSNFEIFQYSAPDQRREQPRNSDIGGHHLAFYVDDIDIALEHLRDRGIRILGSPTTRTEGPSGGQTWVYFLSPWGMQLELVSFPSGKGYEQTSAIRLWHPARPSE